MGANLFVSELLFSIIICVAILVLWQFVRSRNGMLRKIMIAYFIVEIYIFTFSAIYWYDPFIPVNTFRMLILIPKVIVKLWLLWWIVKQNKKTLKKV